uniref:GPI transamidase component GPI8 n=1 Tax=Strongyloides venezuelensis TaxID=75913 RepID=A0A0K0FH76_STRVS
MRILRYPSQSNYYNQDWRLKFKKIFTFILFGFAIFFTISNLTLPSNDEKNNNIIINDSNIKNDTNVFSNLSFDNNTSKEVNTTGTWSQLIYHLTESIKNFSRDVKFLYIDKSYKAREYGLNIDSLKECSLLNNSTNINGSDNITNSVETKKDEETDTIFHFISMVLDDNENTNKTSELIKDKSRVKELGMKEELLDIYKGIFINFEEICSNYPDIKWYNTTEEAIQLNILDGKLICSPFTVELTPSKESMNELEERLNKIVVEYIINNDKNYNDPFNGTFTSLKKFFDKAEINDKNLKKYLEQFEELLIVNNLVESNNRKKRETEVEEKKVEEEESDDSEDENIAEKKKEWMNEGDVEEREVWVEINIKEMVHSIMEIHSPLAAKALNLNISNDYFKHYKHIYIYLNGICSSYMPELLNNHHENVFDASEDSVPIGVNITALQENGIDLKELAQTLRNDTAVNKILERAQNYSERNLGSSYIKPILEKIHYDMYSAPIVFAGSAVEVRFGIYIESMSNFQTTTMDYDMDIYLIMAWRDVRLVNNYSSPILVKEENVLEMIWRPDPFFSNAKEAEYHEVTFLNFLMRIFNDGLVLYETRIKMKPSCNLILCKYPHDYQYCDLKIKSFAYPTTTVRFEWFSEKEHAIDKNPDVKLPELYIDKYYPLYCNRTRKSGDFSCLRAMFILRRDVGYHIAQTYIPTSLALMFSWVGVWLPEEFMEGRIGVAITVLLTLSTESAGAREHLPSVSYLKAIDLWFGYITGFVFFTLLQTLFVIGFDKKANNLKKMVKKHEKLLTFEESQELLNKALKYHRLGRQFDNLCRVFYPVTFILFLMMYFFIYTEGRQDDCITR